MERFPTSRAVGSEAGSGPINRALSSRLVPSSRRFPALDPLAMALIGSSGMKCPFQFRPQGKVFGPIADELLLHCDQLLRRSGLDGCGGRACLSGPCLRESVPHLQRLFPRGNALRASTLRDHLVKKRFGGGCAHEQVCELCAGRFAAQGDASRISVKC